MTVLCNLLQRLTQAEEEALRAYGADSTFHHATVQGWREQINRQPGFEEYYRNAGKHTRALDAAIAKSELISDAVVYSAHARGFSVRGAMIGKAEKFCGLQYSYPGFISTSDSLEWAKSFLSTRQHEESRPTLLEFRLPSGFKALDVRVVNQIGESEYLLGRKLIFNIVGGREEEVNGVADAVLYLELEPIRS